MCEYLPELTTEDVNDIMTMIVAFASAVLLYLTFKSQKKATEIAKQVSEIDRMAKRAEYLPEITGKIDDIPPYKDDGTGSGSLDLYGGSDTKITVKITFNKNPVQLCSFKIEKEIKHFSYDFSDKYFDKSKILLNGDSFDITYLVNFQKYLALEDAPDISLITMAVNMNEHEKFILDNTLKFQDIIGNRYELTFQIKGYKILTITNLKMID